MYEIIMHTSKHSGILEQLTKSKAPFNKITSQLRKMLLCGEIDGYTIMKGGEIVLQRGGARLNQ